MNMNYRFINFLYIVYFFFLSSTFCVHAKEAIVSEHVVQDMTKTRKWHCSSVSGFMVTTLADIPKKRIVAPGKLTISVKNNRLIINDRDTGVSQVRIVPTEGIVEIGGQFYNASLLVQCDKAQLKVLLEGDQEPINIQKKEGVKTDSTIFKKERGHNVRVLLDQVSSSSGVSWHLTSKAGFIISETSDAKNRIEITQPDLIIGDAGKFLQINGKKYAHGQVFITPKEGHIYFDSKVYDGSFSVILQKTKRLLINILDLEDYVFSVLCTESWPGWPLEVNKAFAITSRSYVLAMIVRSQASKLSYHIKNTAVHQTYTGIHKNEVLRQAVDETRGIFLSYAGKPIIAMYDACCGGVITADIGDFNFSNAPYLARKYPCLYCKSCSIYEWQAEYSLQNLSNDLGLPDTINFIKILKKDKAGLVCQVQVKSAKRSAYLTGKNIYSRLKKVKSYCFSIAKKDNSVIFKGRGSGHHLGLCQWGAREMVRGGKRYRDILTFYYPNTDFTRLS